MKCNRIVIIKSDNCIAPETPPAFPSGRVRIADANIMTSTVPIHSLGTSETAEFDGRKRRIKNE